MVFFRRFPTILLILVIWRTISVFVIQTAHVPDEYWQSIEVAHRLAFGYGYLTWEWQDGIRSYIYPFLISLLYRLLGFLNFDHVVLITTLPCILQALLSAYADYRFYIWTRNKWALFNFCTNWYWYYCAPRTMLNTLETSLTTIALSIFPWRDSNSKSIHYLWIVAFLCAMRPTAVIVWSPLCLFHIVTTPENQFFLLIKYLGIGVAILVISTLVDSICYGKLIISQLEFLRANVFNQMGSFYGTYHLSWYLTQGMPVLLGLHCIPFLFTAWQVLKQPVKFHRQAVMLATITWTVAVYSTIAHKEFRFILPLLPLFTCLSTTGILRFSYVLLPSRQRMLTGMLVLTNLVPAIYFCLIHQRGSLDVMKILHQESITTRYYDMNILFLTPCHATPLYSHLHANVSTRFLTCEPNLKHQENYTDEVTGFFRNPMMWLNRTYVEGENSQMPTHVVLFDRLAPEIHQFLQQYVQIAKLFYAHFTEGNYGSYLFVYTKK
ncbi:GPI mannosyltransferase 3 [Athalia rosae]|uniref:GPI mannosyltransferase 3 n=1 Tax=Athalia rosae TaxID=37344 RepID=UPI00203421A1|nr:GPI mannosyltransferase 3 [Athalia rosae]